MRRFLAALLFIVSFIAFAAPQPAPADNGPVLVLGDSLSAAYNIPREAGWVSLLETRLRGHTPPRQVVNAAISGETTAGGLARLPELIATHKPAVVVLELGANDGLRGLPLAEVRANLAQMLETVRQAKARAVLVGIELPVNYGPQYRDGLRAMYRDLAREFNVPLVPFLLEGIATEPDLMQDDGLHPVAKAQERILQTVWPTLAGALGAPGSAAPRR
ncbi:arylesterase [Tahibacter amnicola]|uniref:Arylesterase n=1 Tax=Tahibacter amnicola TaxID=2976241 RepID=A0ABY6BG05_9GAMM|nr:arylesterase [Tahibacter amnicola]UXI67541.1 arylesterase [Tahibacter amnicola]